MSKTLFDTVVGTPPPSTVDVAAIVRRRRRARAARRLGIVLAPVAVAAVTATALVTVGGGMGTPPYTAEPPLATITTLAPGLTADRLRAALAEAVAALVPDARWLPDGQAPVFKPPPPAVSRGSVIVACDAVRCTVGSPSDPPTVDVSFSGSADLQRAGKTGLVMVAVHTTRSLLDCSGTLVDDSCTATTSPHGYAMVTRSYRPSALPNGMTGPIPVTTRLVAIELPGNQVLEFAVNGPKDATAPPDMVLTEAELVSIADDVVRRVNG